MRPLRVLLLSLAAAAAVTSAEHGGHHGMGHHHGGMGHRGDGMSEKPCHHDGTGHDEESDGLTAILNEQFQRSSEMLQRFFGYGEAQEATPSMRVVVLEEEEEEPARLDGQEQKMACMTAMTRLHEQDELKQQEETLMTYFRAAFQVISLHYWDETSCDDLGRQQLIDECNRVLSSEEAVREYLQAGKTDEEVCEFMAPAPEGDALEGEIVVIDFESEGDDNLSCKLCQRFVQMVDQALAQEVQQVQQVRAIIGDLCDAMAKDSMCHTFLNNYDAIVEWLKHGTDPIVVCDRISMCSADSGNGNQLPNLVAADESDEANDWALMAPEKHETKQACFFCSRVAGVVYEVNSLFPDQLPMIKSVLGYVCQLASPGSNCNEVESDFDQIVELVKEGQRPHEVCAKLDLCKQNLMKPFGGKGPAREMSPPEHISGDDATCEYCDAATTVLEIVLQEDPDQIDQLREYADMICSMLGDDSPCHDYVNKLDTVIDALKKGTHPRDICKALKYCSAEMMGRPPFSDDNPRVGMMRNGRHGHHHQVGMSGPGRRHGHHRDSQMMERGPGHHGDHDDWGMMKPGDHHAPHPHPHPHPPHHGSCFFCSRVAMVIHHVNHTSPEKLPIVKTILSNVCQLVPSTCKCDVVDANFDKIVALEKEGKHPHEICKSIGVCNKTRGWEEGPPSIADAMKGVVVASRWTPGNDSQCTYCQFATTVAKIALQQYGADIRQVRTYADMICDMLGEDNPCHVYVKEMDFVIDSITKGMSSKAICTSLKFCTAQAEEAMATTDENEDTNLGLSLVEHPPHPPHHHDPACSFCTHVAVAIHHVNKTSPEKLPIVKTILTNVCKLTSPDCKCDEVDKNFDKIVEMEKEGKCPHEICKTIGLCKKKPIGDMEESSLLDTMSVIVVADHSDAGDEKTCWFCDYVTTLVQVAYEQDTSKIEQIKQLVDTSCEIMGEQSCCHQYVAKLDFVVNSLKNGTHPHAICVSMKYCAATDNRLPVLASPSASTDLSMFDPSLVQAVQQSMVASIDGCFFCTQVTAVIEVAVAQDPSKIAQIRQIADVICQMLPSDNQCHSYVKQFDAVIDSLQKGEKPRAICNELKYCSANFNPALAELNSDEVAIQSNDEKDNNCVYCNGVVTVLKYALDQKPEQVKEMRETAGIVCQLLPADDTCHEDLKMFDEAVTDLQAGKEPHEICQVLKFCTTDQVPSSLLRSGLFDFTGADFMPSRCATCQQNTLLLASLITRPDSLTTFKQEIDSICRLIPESSECELLVKHEDVIIDSLKKGEDVETICTRIEACGPVEEEVAEKSMSVGCLFCEYTADLLEHADHDEKALREAKVTLETMCTILPPRARCDVLSSKFDELVALMREGKSPSEACHSISLCDAAFVYPPTSIQVDEEAAAAQALDQAQEATGDVMEIQ